MEMKQTGTIKIMMMGQIKEVPPRAGMIRFKRKFPAEITGTISLLFFEHVDRKPETGIVYDGPFEHHSWYSQPDFGIGWNEYEYHLPKKVRNSVLAQIQAVLKLLAERGWKTDDLALAVERLRFEIRDVRPRIGEVRELLLDKFVETVTVGEIGGEIYMGQSSKYQISGQNQISQLGDNNLSRDPLLMQKNEGLAHTENFKFLHLELVKLREAASREVSTADEALSLGALAAAEKNAEAGDAEGVNEALKKAGTWSLGLATKAGVPLAVEAIKKALGF